MRRHTYFLSFPLATALLLSGCGGSGGDGSNNGGGGDGITPTPVQSNDYTLSPNAVALEDSSTTVVSASDSTVVLRNAPALTPGQILLHNSPSADSPDAGFVRRVVSSTVSGSTTTVTTSPAGIADVFTGKVNIDQDTDFTQEDLNRLRSTDSTITITPNVAAQARFARRRPAKGRATDGGAVDLKFTNTPVKNASGATVATLNGTMTVGGGLTGALVGELPLGVTRFEVSPYLNVYGRVNVQKTGAGTVAAEMPITDVLPLQQVVFGKFKGNVKLQLFVKLDGNGPTGTSIDVAADVSGKAGFVYTPATNFTASNDLRKSISMTAPKTDTAAYELGASFARPKFNVEIPGLGTASATTDVVRAVATSTATTTPKAGFNSQGFGEYAGTGSAKISFNGFPLFNGSKDFSLPRFAISNVVFYPTGGGGGGTNTSTSQILYIAPGGHEIRAVNPDGTFDRSVVTASTDYLGRPSAQKKIFSAERKFAYLASSGQNPGLFEKTVNTSDAPVKVDTGTLTPLSVAYYPTGLSEVFAAQDSSTRQQIYTKDFSGTRQLTTGATDHSEPTFGPNGDYVYYELYSNGKYGIARIGYGPGSVEQPVLVDSTKSYRLPRISPDGTLGLAIQQGVGVVIYSIGTTNPNPRLVIADPTIIAASFSPDGKQIVVGTESYAGTVRTAKLLIYPVTGGTTAQFVINGSAPEWTARP